MYKHHIDITALTEPQSLARSHRNDIYATSMLVFE